MSDIDAHIKLREQLIGIQKQFMDLTDQVAVLAKALEKLTNIVEGVSKEVKELKK